MNKKALDNSKSIYVVDRKMIIRYGNEIFKKLYNKIDFETFELITPYKDSTSYFKDKNHVYLDSYMCGQAILKDADPHSFHIVDLEKGLASCSNGDYYFDNKIPFNLADAIELSSFYQKVKGDIYFAYQQKLIGVDVDTFKIVGPDFNFARDKNHFIYRNEIVPEIYINTFKFLPECFEGEYYQGQDHAWYAVDANNAYFVNTVSPSIKIIKVKNPEDFKFEVINKQGYGIYGDARYYFGKKKRK
ncbi:DKNYY domain-containing protein [Sphingobacterium bovistauri]|uniref:DKNYY domain-containing protein n=1 Tax=Sphingobacterium bovistauri TaxID=2781959 RepID=A0ABS7Z0N0_9SPHI|nr:DKNYY domain-containing protein [Sphingobacterium bovistauri]MCA5003726.1 DKNYY domain-containing protein [Sphingobacterium bovistauri]